jgi:hypothetical protein
MFASQGRVPKDESLLYPQSEGFASPFGHAYDCAQFSPPRTARFGVVPESISDRHAKNTRRQKWQSVGSENKSPVSQSPVTNAISILTRRTASAGRRMSVQYCGCPDDELRPSPSTALLLKRHPFGLSQHHHALSRSLVRGPRLNICKQARAESSRRPEFSHPVRFRRYNIT